MEPFIETIGQYVKELNSTLLLKNKEYRHKKITKITTQFYLNSRKWAKELGLNYLDRITIFRKHNDRNFSEIIDRFDIKSPKIIELSNGMFFNKPMPMQAETIFATLISTFNEVEYYKENNWYPREFIKDIIVISFLIKSTHFFYISINEAKLSSSLSLLPPFLENDYQRDVCTQIDKYLENRKSDMAEDIDYLSGMVDSLVVSKEINSIDNIIELLSVLEVNNNRISEMITELMEYESKGVTLNRYLIGINLLNAMLLTISDFPIYIDNEEVYYNTVIRLAIITKGLYKEIKIEK